MKKQPYRVAPPRPLEEKETRQDSIRKQKRASLMWGLGFAVVLLADLFTWAQIHDRHLIGDVGATWFLVAVLNAGFCLFCAICTVGFIGEGLSDSR